MADIASALKMEEEALERMKKQSLRKSAPKDTKKSAVISGICNPNCQLSLNTNKAKQATVQKVENVPDLMSFQEVTALDSPDAEWSSVKEKPAYNSSSNYAYYESVNNVLALYSSSAASPTSSILPQQQQSYHKLGLASMNWQNNAMSQSAHAGYTKNNESGFVSQTFSSPFHHQRYGSLHTKMASQSHYLPPSGLPVVKNGSLSKSVVSDSSNGISCTSRNSSKSFETNFSDAYTFPRPSSFNQLCGMQTVAVAQRESSPTFSTSASSRSVDNEGIVRSSSVGSKMQVHGSVDQKLKDIQNDKLTSIFDEWLNNEWHSSSLTASPLHENKKETPDWMEWDPLSKQQHGDSLLPQSIRSKKMTITTHNANSGTSRATGKDDSDNAEDSRDSLVSIDQSTELERFVRSLAELRLSFKYDDLNSNPGHVISPMIHYQQKSAQSTSDDPDNNEDQDCTVRISVSADGIQEPVTFECYVNASVEHIISQALCIAYEDISCVSTHDFLFRVAGRQEYLISESRLGLYLYVRECRKFEQDIRLELLHKSKVDRSLARTADDDAKDSVAEDFLKNFPKRPDGVMNRDNIQILLETFYNETEAFLEAIKKEAEVISCQQHFDRVTQTVKAMCSALGNIETQDIADELKQLRNLLTRPTATSTFSRTSSSTDVITSEMKTGHQPTLSVKYSQLRNRLENLSSLMFDFSQLYCKAYQVDAYSHTLSSSPSRRLRAIPSHTVRELYSVNIVSLHRIPKIWEATYDEFYIACSLWHGDRQINHSKSSTDYVKVTKNFYSTVHWNKWVEFDVSVCELPLEVALRTSLYGVLRSDDKVTSKRLERLAWLSIPVFDHSKIMRHDCELFGMWGVSKLPSKSRNPDGPLHSSHDIVNPDSPVLHLGFSEDKCSSLVVEHTLSFAKKEKRSLKLEPFSSLESKTQQEVKAAVAHAKLVPGPLFNLSQRERDLLWNHRRFLASLNEKGSPTLSLPVLLRCVPDWSPNLPHLEAVYELLEAWPKASEPEESLVLLTSSFADTCVRSAAIRWLGMAEDMEISLWLPQLVQALRCEQRHDSPLARLLLQRALSNVRICHQLNWLLRENMGKRTHEDRFVVMHAALNTVCGAAMFRQFEKERYFVAKVTGVAESVKEAKDSAKTSVVKEDLTKVASRIDNRKFRIPTNPALVTSGLNVKNSSYFASNAVPLKLCFINAEPKGPEIFIMYKVGDDLRQDALTMQLIRAMDRMWLSEGLDLRIVTFDCLPTVRNQGMIEIIPDSKTFREIQSSYGLTGAFKDRPIAEWLQKYNPTGLSYERAVENFTLSCAGYCVATYILGICDRHNDNIMLRTTGHLFHIDFARFLGHAQMFGNIKRDRAPFVLTSDMAYVINGGDRPSSKFHDFVDVCCSAFNILRKHAHTIINLLSLMMNCNIPELSNKNDLKYVYDTLKPNASDTEATTMFTRLIESSLSSSFTRINFFIHNLAQMRFSVAETEEEKKILSFSPQMHGYREEDGLISSASVVGYQKRYSPEKYYIYCVKVTREKSTASVDSYVFRTFDEFEELHRKLSYNTVLQLPSFPNSVVVGRSQVKQVAERRKEKLNNYLKQLLLKSPKTVSMHDLVYTFFHPILRDEEKDGKAAAKSPDITVGGEIKASLHYKNNALYIMVQHCKNLSPVDGTDPDPYVKTYLLPDPYHSTKRKTKVVRKSLHPTYNEMLVYNLPLKEIQTRKLCIGVWNYENFQENDFMGSVEIDLSKVDLTTETSRWYLLKSGTS